jgi:hypothetical protein
VSTGVASSDGPPGSRPNWLRFLLPDLCLSVFTLFYCLFVFDGWRQLFRDSDTGWHIRTGESILTTHALPAHDPYSFTRTGERWFAWEWASDVAMGITHRLASLGLAGVALLYAVAIAAATFLWVQLQWRAGTDFLSVCLAAIPMHSTVNLHWLARPHVFGWLLLLGACLVASRRQVRCTAATLVGVAAMSIVWANVHASFFLFPVVLLVFAVGNTGANARALGVLAGVSLVATLVNPYGWHLHEHVVRYLLNSELLDRVGEFQSFNFHVAGAWQIVLLLMIVALGGSLALIQGKYAHALLIAMFWALALRSARGLPIAALVALPFACGAISTALRESSTWTRLRSWVAYSDRLRMIDTQMKGLAAVPLVLALAILTAFGAAGAAGFPRDQFPVAASEQIAKLPAEARILAPDKFGGYLIYRFAGQRRVFFDGRSDFYGSDFMKRYIRLVEVRPGWQTELGSWRFTHALLPNQYSLIPALQQLGWQTIYQDSVATLLAVKEPE